MYATTFKAFDSENKMFRRGSISLGNISWMELMAH